MGGYVLIDIDMNGWMHMNECMNEYRLMDIDMKGWIDMNGRIWIQINGFRYG